MPDATYNLNGAFKPTMKRLPISVGLPLRDGARRQVDGALGHQLRQRLSTAQTQNGVKSEPRLHDGQSRADAAWAEGGLVGALPVSNNSQMWLIWPSTIRRCSTVSAAALSTASFEFPSGELHTATRNAFTSSVHCWALRRSSR